MSFNVYSLFEVVGVEVEYMVVDKNNFSIRPIVDSVLMDLAGKITNEIAYDKVAISNELVSHVLELKMSEPQVIDKESHLHFFNVLKEKIFPILAKYHSALLPTSMHPLLATDSKDIKIWPHGNHDIYQKYDKIFGCHGHGFSNIQSIHLNLPFADDKEFVELHQAIRLVLPLIPALMASSPIVEGKKTNTLDNRLLFYKNNQKKIAIISGDVIPEEVTSIKDYYYKILNPIDNALSPYNQDKVLEAEWVNSRGAIARFERNAIEIRLMDSQECPLADFACVAAITAILKDLIYHYPIKSTLVASSQNLKSLMDVAIKHGLNHPIDNSNFLQALSLNSGRTQTFASVIDALIERASHYIEPCYLFALEKILSQGNLAERMLKFFNRQKINKDNLHALMSRLEQSLSDNNLFLP